MRIAGSVRCVKPTPRVRPSLVPGATRPTGLVTIWLKRITVFQSAGLPSKHFVGRHKSIGPMSITDNSLFEFFNEVQTYKSNLMDTEMVPVEKSGCETRPNENGYANPSALFNLQFYLNQFVWVNSSACRGCHFRLSIWRTAARISTTRTTTAGA